MADWPRNRLVTWALIASTIAITGALYTWRWMTPRHASFEGTLVALNSPARTGTLRVIHPKSGEQLDVQGEIDPACEITSSAGALSLDQLIIGDRIRAEGRMYRWGKIVAMRLTRLDDPSSQPDPR